MAFLGSLVGRKVKDCYGNRTNLYIFGVAPSGTGKQAAIDGLKEAHHAIFSTPANRHQSEIIGPERWSSDTALVRDAGNRLNVIYLINEIGKILKSISNGAKTSAHLAGISTELLGLYDSAKGSFHGKAYADVRHEIATIHEPHVSIYGTTVRQSLIDSMTAENITDGFLARSFIVEGNPEPERQTPKHRPLPEGLNKKLQGLAEYTNNGYESIGWLMNPQPRTIEHDSEAKEIFAEYIGNCRRRRKALGDVYGVPFSRLIEKAYRLALIYAISEAGEIESAVVTANAAKWACRLSWGLTEGLVRVAKDEISDNEQDKLTKQILLYIKTQKRTEKFKNSKGEIIEGWVGHSKVIRKFQRSAKYLRDAAIATLIESGQIEEHTTGLLTGGKVAKHYRASDEYYP